MPVYNYYCESCDEIFDDLVDGSKYKDPQDCPTCGTSSERTARGQKIQAHGVGLVHHTTREDRAKTEHRWMEKEIEVTKRAIEGKSGVSPYTNFKINKEEAVKQGLAKKVSDKEAHIRRETSAARMREVAKAMPEKDRKRAEDGHNVKDNS
tara:strand:- start:1099 stop:1551 length:453 start_codon:yes stop_codon:yes gene_type:complete